MEVSRTQVFDRPQRSREFFEEVIRDNLDLGRLSRVQLLFTRPIRRTTPGRFQTRVVTHGVAPSVHVECKRCHIKQYFKEERALRTETTFSWSQIACTVSGSGHARKPLSSAVKLSRRRWS